MLSSFDIANILVSLSKQALRGYTSRGMNEGSFPPNGGTSSKLIRGGRSGVRLGRAWTPSEPRDDGSSVEELSFREEREGSGDRDAFLLDGSNRRASLPAMERRPILP